MSLGLKIRNSCVSSNQNESDSHNLEFGFRKTGQIVIRSVHGKEKSSSRIFCSEEENRVPEKLTAKRASNFRTGKILLSSLPKYHKRSFIMNPDIYQFEE